MRKTAMLLALVLVVPTLGGSVAAARERDDRHGDRTTLGTVSRARIVDFRFRPATLNVTRGTRVRWVNRGTVTHTTTSSSGLWDSGDLAPGETFNRRFRRAGTYTYACTIHASMTGTIVVG
jgi:plastocyanin